MPRGLVSDLAVSSVHPNAPCSVQPLREMAAAKPGHDPESQPLASGSADRKVQLGADYRSIASLWVLAGTARRHRGWPRREADAAGASKSRAEPPRPKICGSFSDSYVGGAARGMSVQRWLAASQTVGRRRTGLLPLTKLYGASLAAVRWDCHI